MGGWTWAPCIFLFTYIYHTLPLKTTKCRSIYHTWMVWSWIPPAQSIDDFDTSFFLPSNGHGIPGLAKPNPPQKQRESIFSHGNLKGPTKSTQRNSRQCVFSNIFWRGFVKCQPRHYFWGFVRVGIGNYGPLRFAWFFCVVIVVCLCEIKEKDNTQMSQLHVKCGNISQK